MYPAGSTQSALQPGERRKSPRLNVSSIVLVHLGPDNGGIVINLSVDGVSCQAAMRLGLQVGASLNVRLRGSGLSLEVPGELLWIGAKQKEVGIRFTSLSEKQRHEISNWIERQRQPYAPPAAEDPFLLRPMQAMPGVSPAWEQSAPRSFPAPLDALATPGETSADPLASLGADEDDADLSALLDSQASRSAAPHLEIVPPAGETQSPRSTFDIDRLAEELDRAIQRRSVPPSPPRAATKPDTYHTSPLQLPAAETVPELPDAKPQALQRVAAPATLTKALGNKAEVAVTAAAAEPLKTPNAQPDAKPAGNQPGHSSAAQVLEKWIPPALLDLWRHGTPRHRLLLAGGAMLSLGFFALLLVLATSHTFGSGASPAAETSQPYTAPVAVPSAAADAGGASLPQPQIQQLRVEPRHAPRSAPAAAAPKAPESPLAKFARLLVGPPEPDDADDAPPPLPQIRAEQLGVQVWISKTSGYFYCTDDPYFKTVNPGALMTQGDALQNGYRPILNQFCD